MEIASVLAFVAAFRSVFCPRLGWRLSDQIAVSGRERPTPDRRGAGGLALGAWALQRGGLPTDHIARLAAIAPMAAAHEAPVTEAGHASRRTTPPRGVVCADVLALTSAYHGCVEVETMSAGGDRGVAV